MNKNKSILRKLTKHVRVIPLALLLLTANSVFAQEPVKKESENEEVFTVVDKHPEYFGGIKELMKFLVDSTQYPAEAEKDGIQGRVITSFIVHKDGSTSDINILKGVDSLLDAEAIRVLSLMPKWMPGMLNGENVNVRFTLPVVFRLSKDEEEVAVSEIENEEVTDSEIDEHEVFVVVDELAEFPGGVDAMMDFLSKNIKYPKEAEKRKVEGRVIVNFIVNKDGSFSDIKIVRGTYPLLDAEAVRVILKMPNWEPAKIKGELVRARYTVPIVFKLNKGKRK